jgi:hypothetical protein
MQDFALLIFPLMVMVGCIDGLAPVLPPNNVLDARILEFRS